MPSMSALYPDIFHAYIPSSKGIELLWIWIFILLVQYRDSGVKPFSSRPYWACAIFIFFRLRSYIRFYVLVKMLSRVSNSLDPNETPSDFGVLFVHVSKLLTHSTMLRVSTAVNRFKNVSINLYINSTCITCMQLSLRNIFLSMVAE